MKARAAHVFDRDALDHYAEPRWVSERLFQALALPRGTTVVDPACGFGRIPRAAAAAGLEAYGYDVAPRWDTSPDGPFAGAPPQFAVADFFGPDWQQGDRFDAIVSNPPYRDAERFARLALTRADVVALLLPLRWVGGAARSRWLETTPLAYVMPIAPRPSMPPGPVWLAQDNPSGGTVDFAWFVWNHRHAGCPPEIRWLRKDP